MVLTRDNGFPLDSYGAVLLKVLKKVKRVCRKHPLGKFMVDNCTGAVPSIANRQNTQFGHNTCTLLSLTHITRIHMFWSSSDDLTVYTHKLVLKEVMTMALMIDKLKLLKTIFLDIHDFWHGQHRCDDGCDWYTSSLIAILCPEEQIN